MRTEHTRRPGPFAGSCGLGLFIRTGHASGRTSCLADSWVATHEPVLQPAAQGNAGRHCDHCGYRRPGARCAGWCSVSQVVKAGEDAGGVGLHAAPFEDVQGLMQVGGTGFGVA
jgi:hypothetical protein